MEWSTIGLISCIPMAAGLIATSFCHNLQAFYVSYGVLIGELKNMYLYWLRFDDLLQS